MSASRSLRRTAGMTLAVALVASGAAIGSALPAAAAQGAAHTAAASAVTITTPEVENRTEPLGIDVAAPRFSWVTESAARDVRQTSYRLRVSTSASALEAGSVWDSGVVASDASTAIAYGGPALDPATDYIWRVDVQTSAGDAHASSTFSTGLVTEQSFTETAGNVPSSSWADASWIGRARAAKGDQLTFAGSSWIWTPEAGAPYAPAEPRAFRKVLDTPAGKTAKSAEIVVTADDSFELWVNGTSVGKTEGKENEWQSSKRYVVDLAGSRNVLAARTTNGPNSPAGLLLAVRVTYTDGTTAVTTTDASWKAIKQIPSGFQAPAFDDAAWPAAAIQAAYRSGPWGNGVNPPSSAPAAAPLLRKEFQVTGSVASAKVYLAAGGYADMSLNGKAVNDEVLTPGYTDYDDHAQYTVTDLTSQLRPGANALGMVLGRGFYGMTNGNVWNWQNAPWHDEPVARAILRIQYVDGTVDEIVTDGSWTLADGPTLYDDLYGGEQYDARRVQTGFDTVGFDDTAWTKASEVGGPKGALINQQQQPIRITSRLGAESITEPTKGIYVVKFPRVLAGTVEFTAQAAAGTTIRAQYGEKLLDNGRPNFSNNGGFQSGFQTDTFTLAGTGAPESWAGRFSYKGFQYIEVTGWPGDQAPPLSAFTANVLHTDAPETGTFESSNDIMNRTHRAVVDTLLNNIHGIPTDTPMFEKNGWTGDAAVGAEMFLMNLDTQNLFEKWIGDINDTRDAKGAPLVIAPSSGQWGQWGVAPPWHSAFILIPWWLYQYGGDTQVLAKYYDNMKTYTDLEFSRSPGGVVPENRLGDWVSPEASPGGGNAPEDSRVSGTAYLYTMLTSMQKTATQLGKTADAEGFAAQAAVVKAGFNAAFLDTAAGMYRGVGDRGYRQTHNALALAFGLVPDADTAKRVAASLAADVTAKGDKLNTGSLGSKYLLPVLTEYGYEQLAYNVAVQTAYPSWGYMVENGGTSMWEHWSLEARSRGHYFLGTVDDWFYHYAAGIRSSTTTGYRDITIAPAVTKQLDWAKATTNTPFGPVSVDWKRTGGKLTLATHVPVGSTGIVRVPADNRWAVTEGGKPLTDADGKLREGVRSIEQATGASGAEVVVTVGSGDYAFEVNDAAGAVGAVLERFDALQKQADASLAAGTITAPQHEALSALVASGRAKAADALVLARDGSAVDAAKGLADVLGTVGSIDELVAGFGDAALVTAAGAVRTAADQTIAALLGITGAVKLDATAVKPGLPAVVTATITNAGSGGSGAAGAALGPVTAALAELDETWKPTPTDPLKLADGVAVGAKASGDLGFTVPADRLPGETAASAVFTYRFNGADVGLVVPFTVVVDSPVVFSSLTVAPTSVAPGASSVLTAIVTNGGSAPVAGRLETTVPEGWTKPLPTGDVLIAAGQSATITVPVFVPVGATQASLTASIGATFRAGDVVLATGSAELTVALAPVPDPNTGYDNVDLGESGSEQAHNLTASSSSGTNSEAGLTRRYAGHLTNFSSFEFDTAVVPGKPFVIRATETYDRPQTKKYKVYVDGVQVALRQFSHTGGLGTETYEFVVDGSLATDGSVRVKFENLDDHTFYDPSIADVWTLPVPADTTAPQVVLSADPSTPNRATGWYTASPVTVSAAARDDRAGDVVIETAVDGGPWTVTKAPLSVTADGTHEVRARATDAAGNVSAEQVLAVKLDTVVPETTAKLGDGFVDGIAKHRGTVDFTASDATSGVASTSFRVNGGEWRQGSSVVVDQAGAFTIDYFSVDAAGNRESSKSISGKIVIPDVTPPTVTASVSKQGTNGWYRSGAALSLAAEDSGSGVASVEYRFGASAGAGAGAAPADGTAWVPYTAPVALPEGTTVVEYRATDVEGNVSAVGSLTVPVDATAPTVWGWLSDVGRVTVVATDPGPAGAGAGAGAGSGSKLGSGIAAVEYSLDGSTWVTGLSQLVAKQAKPQAVQVRAVDRAGNRGEVVSLTRSATPPALSVAGGSRLLVEASGFGAAVSVRVELHSDPILLATVTADASGVIATIADVPADFPSGEHRLVLAPVTDGPRTPGTPDGPVTVPVGVIASTGFDAMLPLAFAVLLVAVGGWFVTRRRRELVSLRGRRFDRLGGSGGNGGFGGSGSAG